MGAKLSSQKNQNSKAKKLLERHFGFAGDDFVEICDRLDKYTNLEGYGGKITCACRNIISCYRVVNNHDNVDDLRFEQTVANGEGRVVRRISHDLRGEMKAAMGTYASEKWHGERYRNIRGEEFFVVRDTELATLNCEKCKRGITIVSWVGKFDGQDDFRYFISDNSHVE